MRSRVATCMALVAVLASACSLLPAIQEDAPTPCDQVFSERQCFAMVDVAAAEISKNRGDVAAIAIVPDPPPEGAISGAASRVRVRIALKDGSTHETRMCGGVSLDPACSADPHLSPRSAMGGYTDVPCGAQPADAPHDCPTPFPPPKPDVVAAAAPVLVAEVSIPIDRVGHYEVPLGRGSLPNGILEHASFAFADAWPEEVALRDGKAFLEVRSLEADGKPFDNYYLHGWRPGLERIEAVLLFDVLWFEPGAELTIRRVLVR